MGKYFGTDGFRGEANVDLTVEHAYKVGRYLGYYYGKQHEERLMSSSERIRDFQATCSSIPWLRDLQPAELMYT